MEKIITIDGKDVRFKSTAATPMRYKAQFKRDFLNDLSKLESGFNKKNKKIQNNNFDLEVVYNIIWVLAKTADKSIPEPLAWFDRFDSFDIAKVLVEVQDLLINSISSSSSSKKK